MADSKDQKQQDPKSREELERVRRDQMQKQPEKQVPYDNRQLTPGRDGQTLTR